MDHTDTTGWTEVKNKPTYIELDDQVKISYYLAQYTNPDDSKQVKYELHGNCWAWGVDVSNWVSGTSEFKCEMGLYYDDDASTFVDWSSIDMLYNGQDGTSTWSCKDGRSKSSMDFAYTEDSTSNCHVMTSKSSASYPETNSGIF